MTDWTKADLQQNEVVNSLKHQVTAIDVRLASLEKQIADMFTRFKQHDLLARIERLEQKQK